MLFNSYVFLFLFLPVVLTTYFSLNKIKKYDLAKVTLILFSFMFYGYMNPSYVLILLASVIINYLSSSLLDRCAENTQRRRIIGFCAVTFNIGLLFYFKYYDFFIQNINIAFRQDFALKHIALPLGISFFTFQQISFIVDRIKGKAKHYKWIDYALFVSYFPQLIAGPIVRHDHMIPQFCDEAKKSFNSNTLLLIITIVLFIVLYAGGCIAYGAKGFTHFQTFLNILITNAGLICVACGMTCVMLTGGIDISVGALIAMDCMMLAVGMSKGIGAIPMVLLVILVGVVFGIVQGFLRLF